MNNDVQTPEPLLPFCSYATLNKAPVKQLLCWTGILGLLPLGEAEQKWEEHRGRAPKRESMLQPTGRRKRAGPVALNTPPFHQKEEPQ